MSRKKITLIYFFVIFQNEMRDKIENNFCKSLKKWYESHFKGTKTEFGKFLGVSQGQISNVLRAQRAGDETWRRFVAAKIGMDYDTMIGIEKPENNIVRFESADDRRHYDVIRSFDNKPLAITINEVLTEIEKLSPDHGLIKALDQVELLKLKMEIEAAQKKVQS
jgi:predicted transcriptional regulator